MSHVSSSFEKYFKILKEYGQSCLDKSLQYIKNLKNLGVNQLFIMFCRESKVVVVNQVRTAYLDQKWVFLSFSLHSFFFVIFFIIHFENAMVILLFRKILNLFYREREDVKASWGSPVLKVSRWEFEKNTRVFKHHVPFMFQLFKISFHFTG